VFGISDVGLKFVLLNRTFIATAIKCGACSRNISFIGKALIISNKQCFNSCCFSTTVTTEVLVVELAVIVGVKIGKVGFA
jgi:hypothetical protein